MAKTTWTPSSALALAIARLEAQVGGTLQDYGTAEHIAVARYLVEEACATAKCPLSDAQRAAIKAAYATEETYLGYASNAKKMLVGFGTLPASAAKPAGKYE